MKKNILFINHSIRDGGPGRSLFYLLKHFDYEKFDVHTLLPGKDIFSKKIKDSGLNVNQIINSNFPENLKRQNFTIKNKKIGILPIDVLINIIRLIFLLFKLKPILKKNNIEIIYCNGTLAKFFGAIVGYFYSLKVIWHVRNIQTTFILKYLLNKFSNFKSVNKIICVSNATRKQFQDDKKIIVINNGIDTEEYNMSTVDKLLKSEYEIPEDKIIIGTAGRIVPRKNFKHFIEVGIEILKNHKKNCIFVLVGDTPFYFSQNPMKELKDMVTKEELESKFIFTGYKDKVESYISEFDLFFIPSKYEDPFPRVVIESMSLGKPIVGYDIGGIGEAIDNKLTGYSLPLKDKTVVDKILNLIENEELRLKMSFEARKKAVNSYDSRVIAAKIVEQITSL
tara:strand:+ start:7812 stop:8996 length:1185 start_codon:yes stop_codon:yes gene_type:complete